MKIRVDWYKASGKWYSGSEVEIGEVGLHQKEDFMRAIVNNQHELVDGWTAHGEFTVVTSPIGEADKFVNALFPAHEWVGVRRESR